MKFHLLPHFMERHYFSRKGLSFEPVITFSINNSNMVSAVSSLKKKRLTFLILIKKFMYSQLYFYRWISNEQTNITKRYAPNNEKIYVMCQFWKVKRLDVIKTYNKVAKKIDTKLLLVGDGPERNQLKS